jgi:hypothetical protein
MRWKLLSQWSHLEVMLSWYLSGDGVRGRRKRATCLLLTQDQAQQNSQCMWDPAGVQRENVAVTVILSWLEVPMSHWGF